MLILTRKAGEGIRIGGGIVVTVLKIKGKAVSVSVEAPKDVLILRGELVERKETA